MLKVSFKFGLTVLKGFDLLTDSAGSTTYEQHMLLLGQPSSSSGISHWDAKSPKGSPAGSKFDPGY